MTGATIPAAFECDPRTGSIRIASWVQSLAWMATNYRAGEQERIAAGEQLGKAILEASGALETGERP